MNENLNQSTEARKWTTSGPITWRRPFMLFLHEPATGRRQTKKNDTHKISNSFCDRRAASSMHVSWLLSSCLSAARETPWRQARHSKREKEKEKSNQWTEKSRNDGTHGADLFPRCRVSSDSVCSLSTLGQLHDFPLPQNAAEKRRQTRHKTVKQLTNCVTMSIRAASVCPVQSADCCSDPCVKQKTLDVSHKSTENKSSFHSSLDSATYKRHLIDEPSFVNPSTLSIKYPGRNQPDTHADTCTHSQKRT